MAGEQSMGVRVKLHKGAWWVFINHRGQRRAKKVGDRQTAHATAREIRRRLVAGDLNLSKPTVGETFEVVATRWLESVTASLKPSTARFYDFNLRMHVLPVLADRPVTSITRSHCRDLIAACRAKGLKLASLRGVNRTLSAVLSQAVEDGLLQANPAFRMGKYLRDGRELPHEIQPLTSQEVQKFLTHVEALFPTYHPFFLCALRTGMRLGELLALHWDDIDIDRRLITVRRNKVGGKLTTPKNRQARRVDMSAMLTAELQALRAERRKAALKAGKTLDGYVFLTPEGKPLDGDNVRTRVFYRLMNATGFRRIRFHDLRHTYASLLIQNGESLAYVQKQLGHSSVQVTVDVYGHLIPGANRSAVDRLDDAAGGGQVVSTESAGAVS
jgi:integrase